MNIFHELSRFDDRIQDKFLYDTEDEISTVYLNQLRGDWQKETWLSDEQFKYAFPFVWNYIEGDTKWIQENMGKYIYFYEKGSSLNESMPEIPKDKDLVFLKVGNIISRPMTPNGSLLFKGEYDSEFNTLMYLELNGEEPFMELGEEVLYIDTYENYSFIRESYKLDVLINLMIKAVDKGYVFCDRDMLKDEFYPLVIDYYQWYKNFLTVFNNISEEFYRSRYNNYDIVKENIETIEEMLDKFYELDIEIGGTKFVFEEVESGHSKLIVKEQDREYYKSVREFLKEIESEEKKYE